MSGEIKIPFPKNEGRFYDRIGYVFTVLSYFVFILAFLNILYSCLQVAILPEREADSYADRAIGAFIFCVVYLPIHYAIYGIHSWRVSSGKKREKNNFQKSLKNAEEDTKKTLKEVEELRRMQNEMTNSATKTGMMIFTGGTNTVHIEQNQIKIVNKIRETNPNLWSALTAVAGHIENTKNDVASEYFSKFTEQIKSPEPDKTILRSLWESLVSAAPTLKHMTDIVATISKVFQ